MTYLFDEQKDNSLSLLIGHNRENSKRSLYCNSKRMLRMYEIINTSIRKLYLKNKTTIQIVSVLVIWSQHWHLMLSMNFKIGADFLPQIWKLVGSLTMVLLCITPFRGDYKSITDTRRAIFLVDGFVLNVICKGNKLNGILKLDNVLIVPNLNRGLFSVNVFLNKENNWVHCDKIYIQLGHMACGMMLRLPRGLILCVLLAK